MRVLLAPDCFGGTLTAVEAAEAMAAGWRRARPHDEIVQVPMSDGGPGFLDAMPGERFEITASDPLGRPTKAAFKVDGTTGYVESAQVAGLHLIQEPDPTVTTTYGVGQLIKAAIDRGATTVVLGLGGSATKDGGAGLIDALGIRLENSEGERLRADGLALNEAVRLVGRPISVLLTVATDVDNPLLGPHGATHVFGPQKGASPAQVEALEEALTHWADLLEEHLGTAARDLPGAGAAGGLGFAVLALGWTRESGVDVVTKATGLAEEVRRAEVVVTGEGSFDAQSLRGKVVSRVARTAQLQGRPCLVLAGRVSVAADARVRLPASTLRTAWRRRWGWNVR